MFLAFNQQHARPGRIDVPEIALHVAARDVADGPRQFHPGRTAADNDEVQRMMRALLQHLPLRQFESQQNAAANLDGVLDGFQPRRQRLPVIVSEVGVGRARRKHQVVVGHLRAAAETHPPAFEIETHRLVHQHFRVAAAAHHRAQRGSNVAGREHGQSHLVQQRLKGEVIAAIHQRHVDRQLRQSLCRMGSRKSAAQNQDARPPMGLCGHSSSVAPLRRMHRKAKGSPNSAETGARNIAAEVLAAHLHHDAHLRQPRAHPLADPVAQGFVAEPRGPYRLNRCRVPPGGRSA